MDTREWTPADEPMLDGWMDARATKFLGARPTPSPTDHDLDYAVIGLEDGVPVGVLWFAFWDEDHARVSMLVAPGARKRKVARTLLRAVLRASPASIVKADVLPGNDASVDVLLAADFKEEFPEGTTQDDGRFFVWTRPRP